ncbi:MAG TPA: cation:proton antiporter [Rhizomicrobium sp.]|jgi:CPA2 family monovalent cation:H+ antiporter-2|nr:cation:proton antiporter [Rhizomicrobium sp.]
MHTQNLTALALVLAAAVALGFAMSRLRLPAAAGFILVGVALGPSGLGLIDTSDSIETLAALGVLMLLFIIGMEMRLQSFRKSLPLALGVTALTIVIIVSSVTLFTAFVHGEVMGGAVIGGMLSISSTAVAMKMMEDANEKDSTAGRLALAILVAQDLAVVPLLLLTNGLGGPLSPAGVVVVAGKVILALALLGGFIAVLGRVKSFRFPWSEYLLQDFDIGTLGVLGLCFTAAAISGLLGLSPALGAFLGGLAVGHSTLRRAALTMAQPVQSILLFVFFLSIGLLIDLNYLVAQAWVILFALIVVTGGKTFLNWLLLMLAGESFGTAVEASLFLSPVGEFSFVIASAGVAVGVLTEAGHKLAIAVIAMSLLVSPVWFLMARLFHGILQNQASRIMGLDLKNYRLWRTELLASPAPPGPGE